MSLFLQYALNDYVMPMVLFTLALRNGWKLISPSKSFVVYAATSTEKHQWMSHIKKCVDDLLIKRKLVKSFFS